MLRMVLMLYVPLFLLLYLSLLLQLAFEDFQKKRKVFTSHSEIMNEIRKLSLDSSINSFTSQSFGSCAVKEEIDK